MKNPLCLMFGSLAAIWCAEGVLGSDGLEGKPSVENAEVQAPALQRGARPWSPDTPLPAERDCSGEAARPEVRVLWAPVQSLQQMVSSAELVMRGHAIGRTYDVMRSYDNPKDGQPEMGSDGLPIHSDLPVTLVRFAVDEIIVAQPSASAVRTVDALFPGGLLEDGCIVEPADNPLPQMEEQVVLFATHLGANPFVLTQDTSAVFGVVGGALGRLRVEGDTVAPIAPAHLAPDAAGLGRFRGGPVEDLITEVRRTSGTR